MIVCTRSHTLEPRVGGKSRAAHTVEQRTAHPPPVCLAASLTYHSQLPRNDQDAPDAESEAGWGHD